MEEQQFQRELASYQQEQDFLKHLTTLNTGSILLLVTFLEKLFNKPEWQELIGVAFLSFGVSIVGCLTIHFWSIIDVEDGSEIEITKICVFFRRVLAILAFGGFLIGLISLIVFALKNLS